MRRPGVIAVASLLLAVSLAACSSGGDQKPSGTSPASAPAPAPASGGTSGARTVDVEGQQVTIEGDPGGAPIVRFTKPLKITKAAIYPVSKGAGDKKLADGQLLTTNYVAINVEDGTDLESSWALDHPMGLIMSAGSMGSLYDAFKGGAVHAEALQAIPADPSTGQQAALVFREVDGTQDIPKRATGTPVKEPAGMPQVKLDQNGKPSITPVKGEAPKELQSAVTIQGTGDYVDTGDSLAVQYTGWLWDGKQFDSSWDRGEPTTFMLAEGQLIKGWVQGLAKKQVGSQVVLVIPPDLGYGAQASDAIPANSTLVFVIDILGKA